MSNRKQITLHTIACICVLLAAISSFECGTLYNKKQQYTGIITAIKHDTIEKPYQPICTESTSEIIASVNKEIYISTQVNKFIRLALTNETLYLNTGKRNYYRLYTLYVDSAKYYSNIDSVTIKQKP